MLWLTVAVCAGPPAFAQTRPVSPPDTAQVGRLIRQSRRLSATQLPRADSFARAALTLARQLPNAHAEARALLHLASLSLEEGDQAGTTRYALDASRLAHRIHDPHTETLALINLGNVYYQRLNFGVATRHHRAALQVARASGSVPDYARAAAALGNTLSEAGSYDHRAAAFREADPYLRLSMRLYRRLGDSLAEANVLGNLAMNYLYAGQPHEAEPLARRAVAMSRRSGDAPSFADNLNDLAQIVAAAGHPKEALALTHQALGIARKAGAGNVQEVCLWVLPGFYEQLGQLDNALRAERRRAAFHDSLNSATISRQVATLDARYRVEQQRARIKGLLQQGRIAHLRAEREQARGRGLMTAIVALAVVVAVFAFYYGKVRRQRRRLAASEAALRRLNATKDELMSIIGHDLRGPVAAFQQVGSLVAHYAAHPDPDELRELAQELDAGARELGTLLDNLLHWARTQTGQVLNHPEEVSLTVALTSAVSLFRPAAAAKHVALQMRLAPDVPLTVRADPHLLATVLRNLVSNAIKFTPADGRVELAAHPAAAGWVELTVSDTGVGLTDEQKTLLFSLHPDRSTAGTDGEGGTGLGLLVVRHFVALLGSELRLTSEAGAGARFSFTLPTA